MDGQAVAGGALRAALSYWAEFVERCIAQRLETDRFEAFVKLVHPKHPLPPSAIADFFLRPQPSNHDSLDPRIPPYLQVLTQLGYVDTPSILKALFKYSSSHAQAKSQPQGQPQPDGSAEHKDKEKAARTSIIRWESSYWAEEVIFYSLTKSVVQGKAIPDSRTALEVVKVISKWMALFTSASTAFAADVMEHLATSKARGDMESARAALVALLLRLCENEILVKAVSKPFAKGNISLVHFIPDGRC